MNFQKSHDFGLLLPRVANQRYLIQLRSPIYSIASNYKLYLLNNDRMPNLQEWEAYVLQSVSAWKQWVNKWAINAEKDNSLILKYDDILLDPKNSLHQAVMFFTDECVDKKKVANCAHELNIYRKNYLENFVYFDPDFFRWVESLAKIEMNKLGLMSFYQLELE